MMRAWLRWIPAAVVPALIGAGAFAVTAQAGAAPDLPPKTPEQLLTLVGQSTVRAFSGTFEQTSELGLPKLPSGGGTLSGPAAVLDLLTSSHTARVYVDGPTNLRMQVMDTLAERDVVRRGNDLWLYSSEANTATHVTLPAEPATQDATVAGGAETPAQLAGLVLAAIDPSTDVAVGPDTTVAGRTAYDLVITPRSSGTLVGSVSIAVDAATGLPLSVVVQARGQDKAGFSLAFTSLTVGVPAAERFTFVPPPGAAVQQQVLPTLSAKHDVAGASTGPRPTVSGTGWDAVVELPLGAVPSQLTSSPLFGQLTRAVPGGHLLHTSLLNILLTDDGRILAGSVPVERLQAVAAGR